MISGFDSDAIMRHIMESSEQVLAEGAVEQALEAGVTHPDGLTLTACEGTEHLDLERVQALARRMLAERLAQG